jgi:hypothetical protein
MPAVQIMVAICLSAWYLVYKCIKIFICIHENMYCIYVYVHTFTRYIQKIVLAKLKVTIICRHCWLYQVCAQSGLHHSISPHSAMF